MEKPEIIFHGQSCFQLKDAMNSLVIDPGNKKAGSLNANICLITHEHFDHMGEINTFTNTNPTATIICNETVAKKLKIKKEGIVSVLKPGSKVVINEWVITAYKFQHGLFKGVDNTGFLINTSNLTFGHVGDAVELKEFYNQEIDVLALPIAGIFTASPKKIIQELEYFQNLPKTIILMHWIFRNPKKFAQKLMERFPETKCIAPIEGSPINY